MTFDEFKDYIIVVTSDEPYSKMWHTQLIYTEYLSKNNIVYFVNPPKKWSIKNIFQNSFQKKEINNKLFILNYINRFPASINFLNNINERYNEKKLSIEFKKHNYNKILIWHFDSFRCAFKNNFFNTSIIIKRIYHVIDPFYKNPIDRLLCQAANLIIITSPRNNEYYAEFSEKLINIPQCLNLDLQKNLLEGTVRVKLKFDTNYFVLLGTLSDDIDFDWILDLLKNKDFKLVIIGKIVNLIQNKDKSELVFNHPQVEYLGLLSPQEFYPILKKAKAGIIVYNEERRSKVCSPLKALNYIVSGLPVITNIDCEIPELLNNPIYMVNNIDNFNYFVSLALNKSLIFDMDTVNNYLKNVSVSLAVEKIASKV